MSSLIGEWRDVWRAFARWSRLAATDADGNPGPRRSWLALARAVGARLRALVRPGRRRLPPVPTGHTLWLKAIAQEQRANRRALVLLLGQLSAEQRQQFRKFGYFYVTGGNSQARYRIRPDRVANIDVLGDDGNVMYRLCVAPAGVPVYDVMASQLLHLQDAAAEERLLQKANVFYRVYSRPAWIS